jgi:ribA/ribD-fused uncharacterized protein
MEKIERFDGDYAFLSNFYPAIVVLEGASFDCVECAFQAAKSEDPAYRSRIQAAHSPGQAKKLGRQVTLRKDWESVKFGIMTRLVLQKFTRHPELGQRLLATGSVELVENNHWGDRVWGVCGGVGSNYLGQILMHVRENLRLRAINAAEDAQP